MPDEISLRSNGELPVTVAAGPARRSVLLGASGLVALVFAVFWPVLGFEFVEFDVPAQVIHNPHIRGLTGENLLHIATSRSSTTSYYPVRTLSYAIDYQLWGLDPLGFKLTNLLVHVANVLLVFWLTLRLFRGPEATGPAPKPAYDVFLAAFGSAVFAVHPVVVEPVSWVAGREELLMTLGALGCLHFHLALRRLESAGCSTPAKLACGVGAVVCCAIACLSNAVGAVVPLLITAWDVLTLARPRFWRILRGNTLLWVIGIATVAIKQIGARKDLIAEVMDMQQAGEFSAVIQKLGYGGDVIVGEIGGVTVERLLLILNVFFLNLKSLAWPTGLAVHLLPVTARSFLEADVLLGGAAIVLVGLSVWLLWRRKLIVFGLAWFLLALGPSAQIMPHHIHQADRFLYLPLAGLVVAAVMGLRPLGHFLGQRMVLAATMVVGLGVLLVLDTLSARQVQTWRTTIAMWENSARVNPDNAFAHSSLAKRLEEDGQFERARDHYKIAAEISLDNVKVLDEFAVYLVTCEEEELRNYELGIKLAKWACDLVKWKSSRVVRNLAMAYNNYALDLGSQGKFREAIDAYDNACRTDPRYVAPRFNLALLLATCADERCREVERAVRLAEQACQMADPLEANHLMILAVAYAQADQPNEAIATTERAVRLAEAEGNAQLAELLRSRLELYRNR